MALDRKTSELPSLIDVDLENDFFHIVDNSEADVTLKDKRITPNAILAKAGLAVEINNIGIAGEEGFGVGVCPIHLLPDYMVPLPGTYTKGHDNYGNYKVTTDNSIMVWIPAFYYKIEHNGIDKINVIDIKPFNAFRDTDEAEGQGYQIHRMFINGGAIKEGVFVDKYDWSLTNVTWDGTTQLTGTASSIKNGNPISSNVGTKRILNGTQDNYPGSFSNCISNGQTPSDNYGGAWAAAKSRGDDFFNTSQYIYKGLALLSLAHGQAVTSTTNCAWYDASGVTNFPKGNNNYGADYNDATCTFTLPDDDYWGTRNEARKTGSGNVFAKTTHNGQNCGVADLNGNQWKIAQGLTAIVSTVSITNAVSTDVNTKVQITAATHGLSVGDWVMIISVVGMTDINNKIFKVTDVIDANNFKIASTTVQTYVSGGTVYKGKFYTFKESVDIATVTGGNSIDATDHFDDDFILANMDEIVPNFADGGVFGQRFGNGVEQVIPFNLLRTDNDYLLSSLCLPDMAGMSIGGSNQFGQDYFYQYLRDELCPLSGGTWSHTSHAGVFRIDLVSNRTGNYTNMSGRSSLYV